MRVSYHSFLKVKPWIYPTLGEPDENRQIFIKQHRPKSGKHHFGAFSKNTTLWQTYQAKKADMPMLFPTEGAKLLGVSEF